MTVKTAIAVATAGAAVLAGCGSQSASDQARNQATNAQQQVQQAEPALSPKAQNVLQDAQALAADIATTARNYASGKVTDQQAADKLGGYQQRATALSQRAKDLPATERSRSQLTKLTKQLSSTTSSLRSSVDQGAAGADVQGSVDRLRTAATATYQQLQGRLPADTRKAITQALNALGA
ncbi:hypothetical protein FSW04_12340 [Baekduia soli]|uniref:Lipoprotein n=1 Tax=Baekduia soli TaxID=496014 RepID=A0A5B8U617_9ACTN|nr:hypothetical protein [Baekduia soli]QEC48278.1 hypothetical protein FSW04_12340 [Baekduia soli]